MRSPHPWLLTGLAGFVAFAGLALAPPPARLELGGETGRPRWVMVSWAQGSHRVFELPAGARTTTLTGVPAGPAVACSGAEGLATVCQEFQVEPGKTVPHPGPRLVGRVLRGRRPAAGITVWLRPEPYPVPWPFFFPLERESRHGRLKSEVKTDAQGRFSVPRLAPGTYRLRLASPEGRSEDSKPFSVVALPPSGPAAPTSAAAPEPTHDLGDVVLPEGIELVVTAVDSAGLALGGVRVSTSQARGRNPSLSFAAETDLQGFAHLTDLDGALPTTVTCTRAGFEKTSERFEAAPGRARCTLYRPARIVGTVADAQRHPLPRARVTLTGKDTASVETRTDGSFLLDGIPSGTYQLLAVAPGFRAEVLQVEVAAEQQHALAPLLLREAPFFQGQVIDGASREPIPGAALEVTSPPGGGHASTDEDGRFGLAVDQEGDVWITAQATEHPKTTFAVTSKERSGQEPLVFELWPGGWLKVAAWDEATDRPCGGCSIRWSGPSSELGPLLTDVRGEALSPPLPPGAYEVTLEAAKGSAPGAPRASRKTRTATVYPREVTPVRLGEPHPVVKVELVPAPPPGTKLWASSSKGRKGGPADPDGRFSLRKPPGERVDLELEVPGAPLSVLVGGLPPQFARASLRLPLPQTSVSGRLVRAGSPIGRAEVALVALTDGKTAAQGWSETSGAFRAAFVAPGAYALQVAGREVARFEVKEGVPLDLGAVGTDSPAGKR